MRRATGFSGRAWAAGSVFAALTLWVSVATASDWVEFNDDTAARLMVASGLGANDPDEKDYAWGDVDQDGDIDLVVVRKEPWTSPGKRVNVLFMNEDGVLVDRTALYAAESDVPGDQGFNTPTNDRDVVLVDLDLDGWLDMVTAVTISDNDPKYIGHPRIYINKGDDPPGSGNWQGFRYEEARIPTMLSYSGQSGFNPRFCSVVAGDVTGDGYPDLWFGDYDSSGAGGFGQPPGADYNDRLLINAGASNPGYFTDETFVRFSGLISGIPGSAAREFEVSAFGAAAAIVDLNGDGFNDIYKQTALNPPQYTGAAYNLDGDGFFDTYEVLPCAGCSQAAPYFISVGDLNNDTRPDVVVSDDGVDRYFLNQGNGPDNLADFVPFTFPADTGGFGGNSVIADLDNDGWNDVIITDADVDISGCTRVTDILRNNRNAPNVTFTSDPANILATRLQGVHDVAVFDINGDGFLDMVVGRCSSTEVYIQAPPVGVTMTYPGGLPEFVTPDQPETIQVQFSPFGTSLVPNTATLHYAVDGGAFTPTALSDLGDDLYEGTLPAVGCTSTIDFYVTVELEFGGTFRDPPGAPTNTYNVISAVGFQTTFVDHVEGDTSGWTIENAPEMVFGMWEQAVPNGTFQSGNLAAPAQDATPDGTQAFVTENGPPGGASAANDVDGGPTILTSPVIDLEGTDAVISYARWLFTSIGVPDVMTVEVTADGVNWVVVEEVGPTGSAWQTYSFLVSDYVTPSAAVQVRFTVCDCPNDSVTEAGVDDFEVQALDCGAASCPADLSGDNVVDATDLALLLGSWGPNPGDPADLSGNDVVDAEDLALLLGSWGPCQ